MGYYLIDYITLTFGGAGRIFKRNGMLYQHWLFMTSAFAAGETVVPGKETQKEFYMIFNDCFLLQINNVYPSVVLCYFLHTLKTNLFVTV